jgi:exportin-1
VLEQSQRPSLVLACLDTLHRFLNWIPLGYIFETKLIDVLIYKVSPLVHVFLPALDADIAFQFLPVGMFRNITLKCLTEVGSLSVGNLYDPHFAKLYCLTLTQLKNIIPLETGMALLSSSSNTRRYCRCL